MDYRITDQWDEAVWLQAEPVYQEAFPEHGRKNRALIRRMFERGICMLHTWHEGAEVTAMALTAITQTPRFCSLTILLYVRLSAGEGLGKLACEI
ncbi:hypothetical protein [Paenibacillus pectinilyticus]|uniref:hypothetical protein n=1 Tax=Paenibacillus pectinilyticus TaxID=512399 RepID=UPI000A0780F3|nr:hypothetical protein [Paenibacillus pectinilyticus]